MKLCRNKNKRLLAVYKTADLRSISTSTSVLKVKGVLPSDIHFPETLFSIIFRSLQPVNHCHISREDEALSSLVYIEHPV